MKKGNITTELEGKRKKKENEREKMVVKLTKRMNAKRRYLG